MTTISNPRVTDDDKGEITVALDGRELRGWSYANDGERRQKMLQAREYIEGWCKARDHGIPAQGLHVVQLSKLDLTETIHKARWPADRQLAVTPFADEDRSGREYCFRIAEAVLDFLRTEQWASALPSPAQQTIIGGTNFCGHGMMAAICPTCTLPSPDGAKP